MSSHHIVRDEQEPALLLWEAGQLGYEQVGELLEWSPRVVATRQALAEALIWGIKLDAVWTFPELLEEVETAVAHQAPVVLCTFQKEEGLQEVLQWLKARNQQSVNLLADAAVHAFALLRQLEPLQSLLQIQVLSKGWRYSYFRPGYMLKWLPTHRQIRLISFADRPEVNGIKIGARHMADPVQQIEVQQSGLLKITADGAFWLGEQL